MFCKYCGRQLKEGEVCTCRQPKENPVPEKGKKPKQVEKPKRPKKPEVEKLEIDYLQRKNVKKPFHSFLFMQYSVTCKLFTFTGGI